MLQNGRITSPGGRDEADRHGGICGGSRGRCSVAVRICRRAIVIRNHAGAGRAAGYAPSAPGLPSADPASRHALLSGAGRLSSLFPGPGRGARLQRPLRAGISAERHRDRAAHELPLDARLTIASNLGLSGKSSRRRNRFARAAFISPAQAFSHHSRHLLQDSICVAARLLPSGSSRTART